MQGAPLSYRRVKLLALYRSPDDEWFKEFAQVFRPFVQCVVVGSTLANEDIGELEEHELTDRERVLSVHQHMGVWDGSLLL